MISCSQPVSVVICFQLFLWQFLFQPLFMWWNYHFRCDLLSIVPLTIFVSARTLTGNAYGMLWFAFNCSFDNFCFSENLSEVRSNFVVICFQLFLWQFLFQHTRINWYCGAVVICFQLFLWQFLFQRLAVSPVPPNSCDLLSIVPLTIFVSAEKF